MKLRIDKTLDVKERDQFSNKDQWFFHSRMLAQGSHDCRPGMDILFAGVLISGRDHRNHRSYRLNERATEIGGAVMRHFEHFRLQVELTLAMSRSQSTACFIIQVSSKSELETSVVQSKDYRVAVDCMRRRCSAKSNRVGI